MISESICNGEEMTQNNIFRDIINIDCIEEVKTLNTLKKLIVLPVKIHILRKKKSLILTLT